ncbi:MAG TPA: hypothetical protein VGP90_00885, partial [Acidimicrobiia bacterium]|nr:hypothetical protein [Acidimicrobiia bacterium]
MASVTVPVVVVDDGSGVEVAEVVVTGAVVGGTAVVDVAFGGVVVVGFGRVVVGDTGRAVVAVVGRGVVADAEATRPELGSAM